MKIIDISWPISSEMTHYKDVQRVSFERIQKEPYVLEHLLNMHTHTGTHVDAPLHFLPDGASIHHVHLDQLIGKCYVADLAHVADMITQEDVQELPIAKDDIVLFKTRNSLYAWNQPFEYQFVGVNSDAARWLVQKDIKCVGIDYLGIERNQPNHETHIQFARAGIPILEGLRLAHVEQGWYFLCALPLNIIGLEAAPARAVLLSPTCC
jgi:arylformamidase